MRLPDKPPLPLPDRDRARIIAILQDVQPTAFSTIVRTFYSQYGRMVRPTRLAATLALLMEEGEIEVLKGVDTHGNRFVGSGGKPLIGYRLKHREESPDAAPT